MYNIHLCTSVLCVHVRVCACMHIHVCVHTLALHARVHSIREYEHLIDVGAASQSVTSKSNTHLNYTLILAPL